MKREDLDFMKNYIETDNIENKNRYNELLCSYMDYEFELDKVNIMSKNCPMIDWKRYYEDLEKQNYIK